MDSIVGFLQSVDGVARKHPDLDPGPALEPATRIAIGGPGQAGSKKCGGEFMKDHADGVAPGSTQQPDGGSDHAAAGGREWFAFGRHQGAGIVFPLTGSSLEPFAEFVQAQSGQHTESGFGEVGNRSTPCGQAVAEDSSRILGGFIGRVIDGPGAAAFNGGDTLDGLDGGDAARLGEGKILASVEPFVVVPCGFAAADDPECQGPTFHLTDSAKPPILRISSA